MRNTQSMIQIQATMPQTIMSRELLQMPAILLRDYLSNAIVDNPFLELYYPAAVEDIFEISSRENKGESQGKACVDATDKALFLREELCGGLRDSLYEHLQFQVALLDMDKEKQGYLNYLIALINENGYFLEDITNVGKELNISNDMVLRLLKIIQGFYPAGVGARNLQECLTLQITPDNSYAPIVKSVIEKDLSNVAQRNYTALRRKYHLSTAQLQKVIGEIRKLNPKPGSLFGSKTGFQYIYPEARIYIEGTSLKLEMKNEPETILAFDKSYMHDVEDIEAQAYLRKKKAEAMNLVNSLHMRQSIIRQLLLYLIQEQRDFFFGGKDHLRPLSMKEAADAVGVHPSTITRCVKDKYIETPYGVLPLKSFFPNFSGNEEFSTDHVYQLIKKLIRDERKSDPLSDEKISACLRERNVFISRRTVSKYREQLEIPNQRRRRKLD